MAKPKPIPGTLYTIVKGDRLWTISRRAYGKGSKWRVIWEANQNTLRSGDPNLIYPDEVIFIPGDAPIEEAKEEIRQDVIPEIEGRDRNDFTLVINGTELPVAAGRLMRAIDTAAHGYTASIAWNPEVDSRRELFTPYSYFPSEVYLGGKLALRGRIYTVTPTLSPSKRSIEFEGWSFAADAVDSTIRPPLQFPSLTLRQLADRILSPIGISTEFDIDDDPQFKRVTANPQDTAFSFLANLARQRGVLITSTPQGKAKFTRAASGAPVATIFEDFPPFSDVSARFDGRERFYTYRATGQSPKKNSKVAVAKDEAVPATRFMTFSADDATAEDLQKAADWQRSKQLADALTIPFPVSSWHNPQTGELWEENTLVTVISPSIFVPNGFDFLIRSVEYLFEPRGISAVLNLVPPQVFTGEPIEEPWLDGIVIEEV